MKKILFLMAVLLSLGVYAQENNFKLIGNFSNLDADSINLVKRGEGKDMITIAKTAYEGGKFVLEGYIKYEDNYYLQIKKRGADDRIAKIFIEKREVEYRGEFGGYPLYDIKGSKYAHKIFGYCKNPEYIELRKQYVELEKENSDVAKIKMQKLQQKLYPMVASVNYEWYDEAHPKHQVHLADQYYHDKKFDKFIEQAKKVLEKYPDHPESRRMGFLLKLQTDPELKKKLNAKKESKVGTKMIDVALKDINGKEVKLSDVVKKNKLVLLDFWASWCGPCRAEFPHLRMAYKDYQAKGFEIVAVSLDKKPAAWKKASQKENVPWIDLNQAEGDHTYDQDYGVRGIPYNVLINSEGIIVAENLRGDALEKVLHEKL